MAKIYGGFNQAVSLISHFKSKANIGKFWKDWIGNTKELANNQMSSNNNAKYFLICIDSQ